ncbi:hypothetical protein G6F68_012745 [Rhizopus microsporus]|nr:hypothetical protein G6F68_012745 [Rhizopus microsporus]
MHAAHRLHDEVAGHGFRSCPAHDPGHAVVQALHLPLQLGGRLLHALGGGKRQFARRSRHIAPRRAQEQPRGQGSLQRGQAPASRGLIDLQQCRCAAQCAYPIDGQENPGVVPIHDVPFTRTARAESMHFCITIKQIYGFFASLKPPKIQPSECRNTHCHHDYRLPSSLRPRRGRQTHYRLATARHAGHRLCDGHAGRHRGQRGAAQHCAAIHRPVDRPGLDRGRLHAHLRRPAAAAWAYSRWRHCFAAWRPTRIR